MENSLNPDDMAVMAKVVDEVCRRLRPPDDTAKEMIALRVLAYLTEGERDFDRLLTLALGGGLINAA